jgi:perosamine synthetase
MQFDPSASVGENFIPLCVPEIRGNEWAYLKECLDTGWVSSVGSFVDRFEQELASYVGAKYGVAVVNGTAALHIALVVAGVQPDDEVLVSTLTFIAPANAIRYVGAWPVFIDAEPDYWQMDPEKVANFLTNECRWTNGQLRNKLTGRKVSAILPVHILGHPVDMDPIFEIAHKYELAVIEDATESLGAKYKNTMVGGLGEIACFSFNGNKIITTGGGGMIVTDNAAWAQRARYLSTQAKDDPVESIHKEMGYNYRLTNIQAALGCAQLEYLDDFIRSKRKIAEGYSNKLSQCAGISPMQEASWAHSIFWLYTILVTQEKYGLDSRMLLHKLAKGGIQTRPLWQPLHRSQVYLNCQAYHCDSAEKLYRQALSLPCSVGLSEVQQSKVLNMIKATNNNN